MAKISSVTTFKSEDGVNSDSILLTFVDEGEKLSKEFASPFLNDENMRMWRRIVYYAVLGKLPPTDDDGAFVFSNYKNLISGRDVYVAYDGSEVYAIGKKYNNMFFPEEYGLWDLQEAEKKAK